MLLQRLAEHAARLNELPPPFYRVRSIRWAIHLNPDGSPKIAELSPLATSERPAGIAKEAPYIYRSGQRPPAMLLVDDLRYVTAFASTDDPDRAQADAARRNEDYVALLTRWHDSAPADPMAQAVMAFFGKGRHRELGIPPEAKPTDVTAIMIGDDDWPHLQDSAIAFWGQVARERKGGGSTGICLVCGKPGALLDTIPEAIKSGSIPAGTGRGRDAQLISVNKPAQGRGGKIQLASAPVCDKCGSAAMSALNVLLANKSSRYQTDESVLTWWLRELQPFPWVNRVNNPKPDEVAKLIEGLHAPVAASGSRSINPNAFYAVTLSANQSRAVVRDWLEVPLHVVEANLGRWFADHRVTGPGDGPQAAPLWLMARSTGRYDGQDRYLTANMAHGCERDLLLCALRGTRPPGHLLPHLMQRIRADGHIGHARAALLRLILVRSRDPQAPDTTEENYMAGLDPDLAKPSYQCGRMFAVLEQIQRAAIGEVNATIADKYLAAASATPLPVLTMLRRNATGHMRRLRRVSPGAHQALNTRLDAVMNQIDGQAGIPRTLDLTGQGEFILGYHHQRAADIAAAMARAAQKRATTDDEGEDS